MNRNVRRLIALTLVFTWIAGFVAPAVHAHVVPIAGGRLTGVVLAPNDGPASGYDVLLLDDGWDLVARTSANVDGSYAFENVEPGTYRMGVADRDGRLAPVVGPAAKVEFGGTSVVQIRVMESEHGVRLAPAAYGPKANSWWDRQTRNQKIFWWSALAVGTGAVIWGVSQLLEDDTETPASPYTN